jgi:hypothetical protein
MRVDATTIELAMSLVPGLQAISPLYRSYNLREDKANIETPQCHHYNIITFLHHHMIIPYPFPSDFPSSHEIAPTIKP